MKNHRRSKMEDWNQNSHRKKKKTNREKKGDIKGHMAKENREETTTTGERGRFSVNGL